MDSITLLRIATIGPSLGLIAVTAAPLPQATKQACRLASIPFSFIISLLAIKQQDYTNGFIYGVLVAEAIVLWWKSGGDDDTKKKWRKVKGAVKKFVMRPVFRPIPQGA